MEDVDQTGTISVSDRTELPTHYASISTLKTLASDKGTDLFRSAVLDQYMVFVIPFDGSERTKAALKRAREFGSGAEESLIAVVAIPDGNTTYARQMGWLASDEPYNFNTVVSRLRSTVNEIAPDAKFEALRLYKRASGNQISKPIRKFAKKHDASTVFIGSDNAGRLITSQSSIGGRIATDRNYDVCIVR